MATSLSTPQTLAHTIAVGLAELLRQAEALAHAHDRLALPDHADALHEWPVIVAAIDSMGEAAYRIAELAKDGLIPSLKTLKAMGQAARVEITSLDAMHEHASVEPRPIAPPMTTPAPAPVAAAMELFASDERPAPRSTRRARRPSPPSAEASCA